VTNEPCFKVGPDRAQWVGDRIGARRRTGSWKNVWTSNFMKRWVGRRPWKGCSLAEMHTQNVHQALKAPFRNAAAAAFLKNLNFFFVKI